MTWKTEIKKEDEFYSEENYNLMAIQEKIMEARKLLKTIYRVEKKQELSPATRTTIDGMGVLLTEAAQRLQKIVKKRPKTPITETRADPEYRD
jgi:hypothetical protein